MHEYHDYDDYSDYQPYYGYDKLEGSDSDDIAENMINFLERDGFDFTDRDNVANFISFLQATTGGSGTKSEGFNNFLNMVKKGGNELLKQTKHFTKTHAKDAIQGAVKLAVVAVMKKGLPVFEKLYEDAMQKIPLALRISYAPMAFNLWSMIFKKFKIEVPEEFNPEKFICHGMTKQQCDSVIEEAMERRKKELMGSEYASDGTKGSGDDSDDEEEEVEEEDRGKPKSKKALKVEDFDIENL
ncbi:hypothetical protein BgAZ_304720 [Babesia gibsoni]|uniref:Uncharacterized protein n=1 Tax=Babesia gibsoni TaxID=33632 RepID=A0AAD8PDL3_BABGI|nr:hypothetical protein BgAZ_304720 [Babesia gibsoni]